MHKPREKRREKFDMVTHYTHDTLPIFQFDIDEDTIDSAFKGALELRILNSSFDNQTSDLIVANKNTQGEMIETKVNFVSNTNSHKNENIKVLAEKIQGICKEISNSFYGVDLDFKVINSTVLMYSQSDKISKHIHFPYAFVAATYLHINEKSSPIILGDNLEIKPKNGTCLIFPGHLSHEVKETSEDRIMITMDIHALIGS
jgi:hypothetical protein